MINRIIVVVVGLICGAVTAQGPEFIQQYTQRLGGWRDAYFVDIAELEARAKNLGQTRDEYIAALRANEEAEAQQEGAHWAQKVVSLDALIKAYSDLAGASSWMRVPVFIEHYNPELAARTWTAYKPAVPTTMEGAAYGGVGFLGGWLLVFLGGIPWRKWQEKRAKTARKDKFENLDSL